MVRSRLAWLSGEPVLLSSPHPVDECARRLAEVTTSRGSGWYLDSRTAGLPDPLFRGTVGQSWISVARFREANGRNSFVPWLQGHMEPSADGGTRVAGRVGPQPVARVMVAITAVVLGLMSAAVLAAGLAQAAAGHFIGLPIVLVPLGIAAAPVGVIAAGQVSVQREIPRLITAVNGVLDAAVNGR